MPMEFCIDTSEEGGRGNVTRGQGQVPHEAAIKAEDGQLSARKAGKGKGVMREIQGHCTLR